jgi:hypothetical protein
MQKNPEATAADKSEAEEESEQPGIGEVINILEKQEQGTGETKRANTAKRIDKLGSLGRLKLLAALG